MYTPDLELISHVLCPFVQRARVVLYEKSIPHRIRMIDLANKPQWFLDKSPLGKVPLLLVDGEPVFESAVIAEYLDEIGSGSLHPRDPLARARNRAWIEFASSTLAAIGSFYSARDREQFDMSIDTLRQRFLSLDSALRVGPFFNGEHFSLVDAAFAPVFRYFDVIDLYADFSLFESTPRVRRWREQLRRRPSVQRAVVADYPERLQRFLLARGSQLSTLMASADTAREAG